jgi:hypothetical protein
MFLEIINASDDNMKHLYACYESASHEVYIALIKNNLFRLCNVLTQVLEIGLLHEFARFIRYRKLEVNERMLLLYKY